MAQHHGLFLGGKWTVLGWVTAAVAVSCTQTVNNNTWAYRGPENSPIKVSGLFDPDLHVWEGVALPGFRTDDRGVELPGHDGFGELSIRSSACVRTVDCVKNNPMQEWRLDCGLRTENHSVLEYIIFRQDMPKKAVLPWPKSETAGQLTV